MKSYSQAGQDKFVYELLGQKKDGTFLDIGCHDGEKHSNTKALELIGWHGLLVDIQHLPKVDERLSFFRQVDSITANWEKLLPEFFDDQFVDYLSLDVDDATTATLANLLVQVGCPFRVITIEHDFYRRGQGPQLDQMTLLSSVGMQLMCKNVCVGPGEWGAGGPFEDWYCCKELMTEDNCRRFLCDNQLGTSIVPDDA